MGKLIDGIWQSEQSVAETSHGHFKRPDTTFRNWITPDGSAGPSGQGGFAPEPGRYHLYVAYACPWAHRALIMRKLKGLDEMIGVSVVHWFMGDDGWTFEQDEEDIVGDALFGFDYLHEIYLKADPKFTGRVTVPVLWDKKTDTIVSNESAEIIRMLNSAFDAVGAKQGDYYPREMQDEIDRLNERIYETLNNGVYKSGFARSQEAYDEAVEPLFDTLDMIEDRLSRSRYLAGDRATEADWRLFPTLYRFDAVYNVHFKCDKRRLVDYPNTWAYARELYQWPGISETTHMAHARKHYYKSHESVNPHRIVPIMPDVDWDAPHGR